MDYVNVEKIAEENLRQLISEMRSHRLRLGLPQNEVARRAGIDQYLISVTENKERKEIRLSTVLGILYGMGLTLQLVPIEESKKDI